MLTSTIIPRLLHSAISVLSRVMYGSRTAPAGVNTEQSPLPVSVASQVDQTRIQLNPRATISSRSWVTNSGVLMVWAP